MMRLFNPANERYENSYSYQSAYARPEYSYGLGQDHTQYYYDYESKFQNQSPAFAPASHAYSGMMQQSTHFNSNSGVTSPAFGSFPTKPVEQHSSSQDYSQHGSSYGLGQQGAFGSAQYGSYGMRKQGGIGSLTKHGAYSSHESYGSAQNGLLGPVQQSYGSSQHGSYSSGNHGAHNLGHHGSFSSAEHGTFGSATHTPSTNWAMNRRQKSSYYRRSNNGFRSGDSSDSEEEEEEDESENEHEHH